MKFVFGPRRSGKTHRCLQFADSGRGKVLVESKRMQRLNDYHGQNDIMISPEDLLHWGQHAFRGRGYRDPRQEQDRLIPLVIDEEKSLERLFECLGFKLSGMYSTPTEMISKIDNEMPESQRERFRDNFRDDNKFKIEMLGDFFEDDDKRELMRLREENERLKEEIREYELGMVG